MFCSNPVIPAGPARRRWRKACGAFTLVEVLVSVTILLMMLLIMTEVIGTTQRTWHGASSRLTQFREARNAFDTINRGLSQATINSFRDYYYDSVNKPGIPPATTPLAAPTGYTQCADLGIVMGQAPKIFTGYGSSTTMPGHAVLFVAPLGNVKKADYRPLNSLLCMCGYFVHFDTDSDYLPTGLVSRLQPRSRFRLYQFLPYSEYNLATNFAAAGQRGAWATAGVAKPFARDFTSIVAENILALILAPSFAATANGGGVVALGQSSPYTSYEFNSFDTNLPENLRYHLPTSIQVVMVAMDEESATRVAQTSGQSAPVLFNTTFTNPSSLDNDLRLAREALQKLKVNFRIFSSTVFLPAADK